MERKKIRKYVLDSSVAVKWFVDEEDSDKARTLKDKFVEGTIDITAPHLLKYEVANALRWHAKAQVDRRTLRAALSAIDGYQFLIIPTTEAWAKAVDLSYTSEISPYDAIYLGVAHVLRCQLVSSDKRLMEALPSSESNTIMLLANLNFSSD